jgi:hypothetical protein
LFVPQNEYLIVESWHQEKANKLDYDKIIDDFALRNPRKMVIVNPVGDI